MPEIITLDEAIQVDPGATVLRTSLMHVDRLSGQIIVGLTEWDDTEEEFVTGGKTISHTYSGATAESLINTLNTTDYSTTSLTKTVLLQLQTDGVLGTGTISGDPE